MIGLQVRGRVHRVWVDKATVSGLDSVIEFARLSLKVPTPAFSSNADLDSTRHDQYFTNHRHDHSPTSVLRLLLASCIT